MGLTADREAALASLWNKVLDWRYPQNHADYWSAMCLSSMRTLQLDAATAGAAGYAVPHPLTTQLIALADAKTVVDDLVTQLGGVPDVPAAITALGLLSTSLATLTTELTADVTPDATALAAIVDA